MKTKKIVNTKNTPLKNKPLKTKDEPFARTAVRIKEGYNRLNSFSQFVVWAIALAILIGVIGSLQGA